MHHRLVSAGLFLGLLQNAVLAAPSPVARTSNPGEWTLRGFHWNCSDDKKTCVYAFSIEEDPVDGKSPGPAFCHFVVRMQENSSGAKTTFSDIPCEDLNHYRCGGSYNDNGYMVLTVDNVDENRRAYFGFRDEEINGGGMAGPHQSPAYIVTAATSQSAVHKLAVRAEGDEDTELDLVEEPATVAAVEEARPEEKVAGSLDDEDAAADTLYEDGDVVTEADYKDEPANPANETKPVDGGSVDAATNADATDDSPERPSNVSQPVPPSDAQTGNQTAKLPDAPEGKQEDGDGGDDAQDDDSGSPPDNKAPENTPKLTVPAEPTTWGLRNITRDIEYDPNTVKLSFIIDVSPLGSKEITCELEVDVDDNADPMFASWTLERCEDSGWYVSWGYDAVTDAAVATVINPEKDREAWFG
ncbi:hypothetical protein SPI_04577 [Niveomyces insectorum RCEF 264]|uniref:Uncharacterized protein n=1 Tax=Niveomyces insectorum RCEF 264 TaxID=1081102 RepID=A0A167UMK8_9HYPO|nr:hypothetical protein SPI_04577 [Niveomyces insectorum RCEF 264]